MRFTPEQLNELQPGHRKAVEALQAELDRLTVENAELKAQLGRYIDRWETLDGDALETLLYLSRCERGHAAEIAQANRVNIQIVEAYLRQLTNAEYVHAQPGDDVPHYRIATKGQWYLKDRGLLKRA